MCIRDSGNTALFYDTDNRRFVGWSTGTTDNSKQILSPLQDPEEALFSFKTGMELIYMESTRFSNGLVYAILQDQNGQRHIYGINMGGNGFVQESKYENLQAPGFDQALSLIHILHRIRTQNGRYSKHFAKSENPRPFFCHSGQHLIRLRSEPPAEYGNPWEIEYAGYA